MRNGFSMLALVAVVGSSFLAGCRFKGGESFLSATEPNKSDAVGWSGDPYAAAGIAEASGGTKVETNYAKGAATTPTGKLNPAFDQPAKGTGAHDGEHPVHSGHGFGNSNAPAAQTSPSGATSSTVR